MKKLIAFLFIVASLFAADFQLWQKSTLNSILKNNQLRVCLEPGYVPFEMRDKHGRIIGFDVDIAKKMAKDMGVKLKLVPTAWDGIISALMTNKCDIIISGMTITQKRNLKVAFSDPYFLVGQTLLVNKKHSNVKSYKDLDKPGIVITTKLGTTGEIAARKLFKHATIKTFDSESAAVQEVLNNRADAFIYDKPYNELFMAGKGKGRLIFLKQDLTYEPLGFAINHGDPDFLNWLNNFLRQIKHDGTYEKFYNKWFRNTDWLKRVQ
ncbi:transporter substrate-binding domain-containing protein [Caminibacter pacificus]|jgi:polar amino acid transport system substrate-binding protein|uniref:Amino acid ABC transporter substrate-binding protein (PAAT family) n=1 Tax=Caminibacter pacificus TaxID=1424653 RepID=A0AAJ4UYT9_9BACT|nr:transporter substrate-binding domain-containing protein [Caminibacter pacificus]NPA87373.1 transporter substrate-binding domain-containing protein [Campylobacterota bacterium]QCI28150.1 transporter substrate-binding domain-containing protein [Caminibacter pacificus]ROR41138.1 amino acid ABC transporter substrate-binding protein (PAAT family) [Caminibacter pacificus]